MSDTHIEIRKSSIIQASQHEEDHKNDELSKKSKLYNLSFSFRFNIHSICFPIVNWCNFSWTPYFYDTRYGGGERVIQVMARESKLILLSHILQILYLFIWFMQSSHNGLFRSSNSTHDIIIPNQLTSHESHIINNHIDQSATVASNKTEEQSGNYLMSSHETSRTTYCSFAVVRHFVEFIELMLTFDNFFVTIHSKRINMAVMMFILSNFIKRIYCLLRRQKTGIKMHGVGSIWSNEEWRDKSSEPMMGPSTNSEVSVGMRYTKFLFVPKLSLREHMIYLYTDRELNDRVIEKYPILKKMTVEDLLKFDLMAICNRDDIICGSLAYKIMYLSTYAAMLFMISLFWLFTIFAFILLDSRGTPVIITINRLLLTMINTISFCDIYAPFIATVVLYNRLNIFHLQLTHFHHQCQAYKYHMLWERFKNRPHKTKRTKFAQRKRPILVHINDLHRHDTNMDTNQCKKRTLNEECTQYITILHRLLYEFKTYRGYYMRRTDLDLIISLYAAAWHLGIILFDRFNCNGCSSILEWGGIACLVGHSLNVLIQMSMFALVSQKVTIPLHAR